jgi:magnesium-transporting ATPase (P-type)
VSQLKSNIHGLSTTEAVERLRAVGPNVLRDQRDLSRFDVFARLWRSPLLLLPVFAALAAVTGQWIDAGIVLTIAAARLAHEGTLGAARQTPTCNIVRKMP